MNDSDNEWFSSFQLAGKGELPKTPQGINKIARLQNWKKRSKKGVQGRALEYHYSSLPFDVQEELGLISIIPSAALWEQQPDQGYLSDQEIGAIWDEQAKENEDMLQTFLEHIKEQHKNLFDLEDLSKQERVLIDNFRILPSEAKKAVSKFVKDLSKSLKL